MKWISLCFLACLSFLHTPAAKAQSYDKKQLEVTLRRIGFDLLRKSGDSTSRVMPVEYLKNNTYRIHFENPFQFVTDTLINTVDQVFKKQGVDESYIVIVKSISPQETIYSYEVSSATDYQIPCLGVLNPMDKYFVEISFLEEQKTKSVAWLILGLLMIGGVGLLIYKQNAKQVLSRNLGMYYFDDETRKLSLNQASIPLTHQEEKLLELFFKNTNELVSRNLLLDEIWEKEGVVVTPRSLDVLVSKLRKKLSEDENIKISNIHGKGYKLEVING